MVMLKGCYTYDGQGHKTYGLYTSDPQDPTCTYKLPEK